MSRAAIRFFQQFLNLQLYQFVRVPVIFFHSKDQLAELCIVRQKGATTARNWSLSSDAKGFGDPVGEYCKVWLGGDLKSATQKPAEEKKSKH